MCHRLMKNLEHLQEIATANGGNRAFGLPGYAASVDYVLSKVSKSKSYKSWTQDFPALYNDVVSITSSASANVPAWPAISMSFSRERTVANGIRKEAWSSIIRSLIICPPQVE